ncbi:cysteine hydrolase family protein [Candidatus Mycobacterium methanotrophicum]|uniref:Cysteine hydrolase n=1 Tax=Candidatus Mycobacterium methanotrophicum TaxID=2943498 RepID=A0ABY4QGQ4_9MYCO|nr:isochorismatase family cysteine hydrolase [Candidatus Mycobacterium methanotrophicum]UQX09533.1 cysteine hydrolase [Candidatus Mycobacterium methanotrophicum]
MSSWIEPHLESAAVLTIDVQVDTLDGGALEIAGTSAAVPRIAQLCRAFRDAGHPIVHIVRLYSADGSNAEPVRRDLVSGPIPMLRPGTSGRLLAAGLTPGPVVEFDDDLLLSGQAQHVGEHDVILYKPRWGAFYGTRLERHLQAHNIDTVVVAGCNYPNCPRTTIYEARLPAAGTTSEPRSPMPSSSAMSSDHNDPYPDAHRD